MLSDIQFPLGNALMIFQGDLATDLIYFNLKNQRYIMILAVNYIGSGNLFVTGLCFVINSVDLMYIDYFG